MSFLDTVDFESTVRDFEFTRRAQRQIITIIESDDFADMDSETIFRYLYRTMEMVSFKDYLKRYIYERAGIPEPFRTVSDEVYREIIAYSFEENAAPHFFEPTTAKWTATIKGWLHHDSVRRSVVFLLGFGLRMNDQDVSAFLTKVLKDEDFNFSDPTETVFWYCYRNGKSYAEAQAVLREAENYSGHAKPLEIVNCEDARNACLDDRSTLIEYTAYLKQSGKSSEKRQLAYSHFCRLIDLAKIEVARMNNQDFTVEPVRKNCIPDDISPADIEKVICCGIPVTKSGNLQKASSSLLSKQFQNFRLSRQRIDGVMKQQLLVDRYDLITLVFFLYSQKEYESPEDRLKDFMDETNRVLRESGLQELHPVNPYEAFVLMCLLSEVPLATYADVWEMSFSEESIG